MKFIHKAFVIGAVLVTSCKTDLSEYNLNPNDPNKVPTAYLLTGCEKVLMDRYWDRWNNGTMGMMLSQYWAQNAYAEESRYAFRAGVINGMWADFYTGSAQSATITGGGGLQGLQQIIDICKTNPTDAALSGDVQNQMGVARTLKAWGFQIMTDFWGDIPYSEAFTDKAFPKYDTQEAIYTDLLKELKEAAAQLDATKGAIKGDAVFNGDIAKWKKFANSLRVRVATRMADRNWAVSKTAIEEAVTGGVFTGNADNALFGYLSGVPNNNPLNEDRKTRQDFASSKTIVDTLKSLSDPRLSSYAAPTVNGGSFIGKRYGLSNAAATAEDGNNISQPSGKVLAATAPGVFMDYTELCFALAEAKERGATLSGTAEDWYNKGVRGSMSYWGVSATDADTYLVSPKVAYATASPTWKKTIGFQKWLGLYMQGIQGWSEYRRLDFGVLTPPVAVPTALVPKRMTYPTDEQGVNSASRAAAVARLNTGTDSRNARVWWDMN
jgi:hypothetical protein